jgi:hypothetical protein
MATTTTSKSKGTVDSKGNALYLQVTEKREDGYFHIYARVVTQRYEDSAYVPQGPDDDYADGLLWSGLEARCQGDDQSRTRARAGDAEAVYGFDVEYREPYSIGLRKARRMLKTLEKIDRGLDKLSETRGYVRNYGEYLGRLAEVLGCAGMAFQRDERGRSMTGQRWQWDTIGEGVNRANRMIWQWQEDGKPARAAGEAVAS